MYAISVSESQAEGEVSEGKGGDRGGEEEGEVSSRESELTHPLNG